LHKPLSATMEFIIESGRVDLPERPIPPEIVIFYITQDTQRHPLLPDIKTGGFRVTGKLATQCSLQDPLSGELTVEASSVPITSIDIHLLRVESIIVGERIVTETSLIQSTQIADGDVCRNMTLPIYVLLPRLLMCPSVFAGPFSVEFKVCITISFKSKLAKAQPKSDPTAPRLWVRKTFFLCFYAYDLNHRIDDSCYIFSDGAGEITAGTCPDKARSVQLLKNKLTYMVNTCFSYAYTWLCSRMLPSLLCLANISGLKRVCVYKSRFYYPAQCLLLCRLQDVPRRTKDPNQIYYVLKRERRLKTHGLKR
jgi:hypothetical protein